MIKKLDKLVIRAFVGPFAATFLISLFVLVMQFFWLYIDDLVGKGLDMLTVLKLMGYVCLSTITLALPLALLLSSIMTFGNLGESFELVAIKSAGIPLLRFMRPVFVITLILSGVAFLFANNISPVVSLKLNAMKYDIIVTKPALDIREGVFYDKIEGFVIKVGKKEKDDSTIRSVIIYEKTPGLQDKMLVADHGVMRVTQDKRFLEFKLYNGWRYEEEGNSGPASTNFYRIGFHDYTKLLDLSSFKRSKTDDSLFRYDPKMLSLRQLHRAIDSLNRYDTSYLTRAKIQLLPYVVFGRFRDSNWNRIKTPPGKPLSMAKLIPDSLHALVIDRAQAEANTIQSSVTLIKSDYDAKKDSLRKHWIEWNHKFTLPAACIVLFMIGAPLGSIIRKGGLGTPLVFAIVFFVIFHLLNTFGEKFAKEGVISPGSGTWLSTAVLVPIGCFLIYKAMRDSTLFNKEAYSRFFRRAKQLLGIRPQPEKAPE